MTGAFLTMNANGDLEFYAQTSSNFDGSCCQLTRLWHSNTAGNGWNGPGTTCARKVKDTVNNVFVPPLENDIKQLANDPANIGSALSSSASSVDNPANWFWWGSFGVFSAFPYTVSTTVGTFAVNGGEAMSGIPLEG